MKSRSIELDFSSRRLTPFQSLGLAFTYDVKTPAHAFTTFIAESRSDFYLSGTARDYFSFDLAADQIVFTRTKIDSIARERTCQLLEGFQSKHSSFEALMVAMPVAHSLYKQENPDLHMRVLDIFPCYRCEFTGDESSSELQLMRKSFVATLDWQRPPSPKILMRYENRNNNTRSTGHLPALAKREQLQFQLEQLPLDHESWIQLENFLDESITVRYSNSTFLVYEKSSKSGEVVPPADLISWIDLFLTRGLLNLALESPHETTQNPENTVAQEQRQPNLIVFLEDYERERSIKLASDTRVPLSLALEEFDRLSDTNGSFVGFKRDDGSILQLICGDGGRLDADIPLPHRRGSLQRAGTYDDLRPLIGDFAHGVSIDKLPGFTFFSHS